MLAFSNFGHPPGETRAAGAEAVRILDGKRVDFEYDGEMGADRRAQQGTDGRLSHSAG